MKWILIYGLTVVLGYILFPAIWGFANGVIVAPRIISDPTFQKELEKILTKEELKTLDIGRLHQLPESRRSQIETLTKVRLSNINWWPVHVIVNALTFGVLGFILGFFRIHRYAILIPTCLLPGTLVAEQFSFHSTWLTITVGLTTQLVAVYAVAIAVARLRTKFAAKST